MDYPKFFDEIPKVIVYDHLAAFLGSTSDGILEYRYIDAVKLAGHSCPTVAASYWMTRLALNALYGEEMASRGGIRVEFSEQRDAGVTGVMATVVQLLTGAAGDEGFKGLSGIFFRRNLMTFGIDGTHQIRFTNRDNRRSIDVSVDLSRIPMTRELSQLLQRCLHGEGSTQECRQFGEMWQERVRKLIFEHGADPEVFKLVQGR